MSSTLEKLSHYGILVVALSAVFVSVWQVKILKDHNKLSVRPLMDFNLFTTDNRDLEVTISNRGIGPAIIKSITYTFQETEYSTWDDVLGAAGVLEQAKRRISYGPNTVLSPDSEHVILVITKAESTRFGIKIDIVFSSIYQEEFTKTFSI